METAALVVIRPPALLVLAVSKWLPLESVVVLSEAPKGALVTAGPVLVPPPPPPEPELPQAGKAMLLVNGEAITQVFGCGGIGGGGSLSADGDSACCAAASKVLLIIVTGSQPPPFQKLFTLPSDAMALAILFDI